MKKITVKVQELFYVKHNWKTCPIPESSFLQNEHVHNMTVVVEVEVNHSDRAVEFFVLRKDLINSFGHMLNWDQLCCEENNYIYDIGSRSMEMVSEALLDSLAKLGYNVVSVECSEDGYFSGKVTNTKEE